MVLNFKQFFRQPLLYSTIFWYLSLFPGRLPFDSSDAIRMLQKGESTEQWTPLFFWMLKLSTFNGSFIYLASALMAIGFLYSFHYFIHSIPLLEEKTKLRALFVFTLTPVYGFWSVTVSHDSTFTIGFVMTISMIIRELARSNRQVKPISVFVGTIFLLTSWLGYVLVLLLLLSFLILKRKLSALLCLFAVLTAGLSSIGINSTREDVVFRPLLVDLKCVAQHPKAVITPGAWERLLKISPKTNWLIPVSCSSMDGAVQVLYGSGADLTNLRWSDVIPAYFQLLKDNPAIMLVGHIQRSSVALPPLLFQPPKNQVSWDLDQPVGLGTNTMIQQGPEVLHPSVDEKSVDITIPIIEYLGFIPQLLGFLVNQASWFWGWGGLWILFLLYLLHTRFQETRLRNKVLLFSPLGLFHFLLFILMPDPTPRYVLPTILLGGFAFIILAMTRHAAKTEIN